MIDREIRRDICWVIWLEKKKLNKNREFFVIHDYIVDSSSCEQGEGGPLPIAKRLAIAARKHHDGSKYNYSW